MARSASGRSRGHVGRRGRPNTPGWGWEMFTRPEQSRFWLIVGFVVRRRAELTVITVVWLVVDQLDSQVTPGLPEWMTPAQWAWLLMATILAVVLALPALRRFTLQRCTAVAMRHRMRACFVQTRTWTANGRLPFLVWSRPTPVGVRVRVWLPAGLSVNDLERIIDEIGAACWAREARITPVPGQAALVWVDIIRRDPLGAQQPLSPPVLDHLGADGRPTWLPRSRRIPTGQLTSRLQRRHREARMAARPRVVASSRRRISAPQPTGVHRRTRGAPVRVLRPIRRA